MKDRDVALLEKIIQHAEEVEGTILRFSLNLDKFKSDYVAKNAITMCILQIGELANNITDEMKLKYDKMPWRDIVGLRNRVAHTYSTVDKEILWHIATSNIPELKSYCEKIINQG